MNAIALSTLLLVSPASSFSTGQLPSLVEPESGAWAVIHAGELWVCWSPGPDCFERVVFEREQTEGEDLLDEQDPELTAEMMVEGQGEPGDVGSDDWRLGFAGAGSLWVERGEQRWRVVDGQRRAQLVGDPAPVRLGRVGPAGCGPDAMVPAIIAGRLSFREAPRCQLELVAATCVTRAARPRLRTPTPVRLRASVEVASARAWTAGGELVQLSQRRLSNAVEVHFVVELGFDWQRRVANQRAASLLVRRSQARLRELPSVSPGPLAGSERAALATIVCEGGRS